MRPNLINRLKEEWNNLDPVDPLRGLLSDAIDALADRPAQQALDKKAENARELGLDYEPPQQDIPDLIAGALGVSRGTAYDMMREALAEQSAQQEHITDGSPCWCNPDLDYKDPDTGAEVWIHKEPQ